MGDEDGMTVAKQLRSQMESKKEAVWGSLPLLIFVTGYPEYMQEAFSVNAFQYIVKPIQESNFEQVFAQTIREYQYLMAKKKEKPKEVLVRNGNRTRSVSADDIYYIERGYEEFEAKLASLGAVIEKVSTEKEIQKFTLKVS